MKALVWFVSVVMALIYISVFVVCVFPNADFFFGTVLGYFKMMLMSSVLGMTVLSYHRIITTPPGFVPRGWKPSDIKEDEAEEVMEKFRRMDSDNIDSRERQRLREEVKHFKYRYCVRCDAFKPPRSHHCRECKACVLRMDHHCPWVNNCVGHYNHKYFMVFLLWGLVGIGYGAMMFLVKIGWMLKNISDGVPHNMTPIQGIIIISNFCLILPMSLGMLSLLVYHLELAATNTTTIEYNDRFMAMKEARRNKREYIWPYDFGWKQNLDLFFGKSIFLWCLPVPSDRWNFDPCHYPTVPISPALELIA